MAKLDTNKDVTAKKEMDSLNESKETLALKGKRTSKFSNKKLIEEESALNVVTRSEKRKKDAVTSHKNIENLINAAHILDNNKEVPENNTRKFAQDTPLPSLPACPFLFNRANIQSSISPMINSYQMYPFPYCTYIIPQLYMQYPQQNLNMASYAKNMHLSNYPITLQNTFLQ